MANTRPQKHQHLPRKTPNTRRPSEPSSNHKPKKGFQSRSQSQSQKQKSSILGYTRRHQSKSTSNADEGDIYEYQPDVHTTKSRRANVSLSLDRDETLDAPRAPSFSDDENEDEGTGMGTSKSMMMIGGRKVRLVGENDGDEGVDSGDDEEIDSDCAFDEGDEERFAGFAFKSDPRKGTSSKSKPKKKSGVRFAPEVDLNESSPSSHQDSSSNSPSPNSSNESSNEEEEEEGNPEDFIDILDILDGRGEPDDDDDITTLSKDVGAGTATAKLAAAPSGGEEEEGDANSEEDEEYEEEEEDEDEDEDEEDTNALSALSTFISSLPSTSSTTNPKKRKTPSSTNDQDDAGPEQKRKRRTLLKERTQAGEEGEFRANFSNVPKLALGDLLTPLESSTSTSQSSALSALSALKKNVKALAPKSSSSNSKSGGGGGGGGTLPAPLPQRTQDRLDREAAYEQTKKDAEGWSGAMKRIREAERLSFPLQAEMEGKVSNLELAAKFKPTTPLETSISTLLKAASLLDPSSLSHTEDLQLQAGANGEKRLTMEEVAERRAELMKMRELMFRAEVKAKRVKRIKSKVYRRLKRKAKEKLDGAINASDDDDDEDEDGEGGEEGRRLKREVERARERATLKYRSTGKWASSLKRKNGHGGEGMPEDERRAMEEMLRRGEKLRRRIQGVGSDDENGGRHGGSDDDDDDDDDEKEGDEESVKRRAFEELALLDVDDTSEERLGKGVFEMKFMRDAMARKQAEADRIVDDFVDEMRSGSTDADEIAQGEGVFVQRTGAGGRISYRPGPDSSSSPQKRTSGRALTSLASDTSSVTLRSSDFGGGPPASPQPQIAASSSVDSSSSSSSAAVPAPAPITASANAGAANPWLTRPTEGNANNNNSNNSNTGGGPTKKRNEVLVSKDSKKLDKARNKLDKKGKGKGRKGIRGGEGDEVDEAEVEVDMESVMRLRVESAAPSGGKQGKGKTVEKGGEEEDESNSELDEQEKMLEDSMNMQGKKRQNNEGPKAFEQRDLVALAFAGDNVVKDFEEAKRREIAEDAPKQIDTTLKGWGSWGGLGTTPLPPKPSLLKSLPGISPSSRLDHTKPHIIISEKRDKKAAKYMMKDLPYPYTSKAQYERGMERPLGVEWNTRVGFERGVGRRVVVRPGVVIEPIRKV